jgi:hypothetical protein
MLISWKSKSYKLWHPVSDEGIKESDMGVIREDKIKQEPNRSRRHKFKMSPGEQIDYIYIYIYIYI